MLIDIINPIKKILLNAIKQTNEYQADYYAVEKGYGRHLAMALLKVGISYCQNFTPTYLYTLYFYRHPSMESRIDNILKKMKENEL